MVPKNGEAKAVILGIEDFLQAITDTPRSLAALQTEDVRQGTSRLTLEEIEAEIAAIRSPRKQKPDA